MKFGSLFSVATCLLLGDASASDIPSSGFGPGPVENATLFSTANQHPNATGNFSLPALDAALNHFEFRPISWRTGINVTEVPWTTNETITNTVLSLSAPPEFFPENQTVWESCLIVMLDVKRNATVKGQDDTGDCHATFGEDCVGNWTKVLQSAMADAEVRNGTGTCSGMIMPQIPSQCQGSFTLDSIRSNVTFNSTMGGPFFYDASSSHDISNTTDYEIAATRIWPLVLIQSSVKGNGGGATSARMSCLRASNATTGSKKIGDVPGAGIKLRNSVSFLGFVLVMALTLM